MPIKFRCQHCRQFLGISRTKAGAVVDCPACGRSIRVPELDGRVEPIPEPELNLDDSELVQALDELASIGAKTPTSDSPDSAVPNEPSVLEPKPTVQPEPILVPPLPMAKPLVRLTGEAVGGGSGAVSTAGPASDPLAPLAAVADLHGASTAARQTSRRRVVRLVVIIASASVATAVVFFTGYVLGHRGSDQTVSKSESASDDLSGKRGADAAPAGNVEPPLLAVRGSITYKTESGESRPDRGARVIVFPQGRAGSVKLSATGFRPGDQEADFKVAVAALRALGGDAAIVGESGSYEVTLPAAGNYYILVLSQFQARAEARVENAELLNVLTQFFDRAPEQLLGRLRCHGSSIVHKGDGAITWNYSFERE